MRSGPAVVLSSSVTVTSAHIRAGSWGLLYALCFRHRRYVLVNHTRIIVPKALLANPCMTRGTKPVLQQEPGSLVTERPAAWQALLRAQD